jgi:hypothetical protein
MINSISLVSIKNLLDKYKTQLLITSIIIIILYFSLDNKFIDKDRYFIDDSAKQEYLDKMKVYKNFGCKKESDLPVQLNLSKDDEPLETCSLYAKGKGWSICSTCPITKNKINYGTCSKDSKVKLYNWLEKPSQFKKENVDKKIVIPKVNKSHVVMYTDSNFKGSEYKLEEGKYPYNKDIQFDINTIRSIKVNPMMSIKIYSKENFQGKTIKLVNPTEFIDDSNYNFYNKWKNEIGSIEIIKYNIDTMKPYVILYDNCEKNKGFGEFKNLREGEYSSTDLASMDIRDDDIKFIEVGPYTVVEVYADSEFSYRITRIVNSTDYIKKLPKCIDKQVNSIKVKSYDSYIQNVIDGIPNIELFHNINNKTYKIDLEEGEYNDLKGQITKMTISPNTIVLFKKNVGKDKIFTNNSSNKTIDQLCDIDCDDLVSTKIVRYDEFNKSTDKYVILYEHPDYNSENDGYEIKLTTGRYTIDQLKKMGVRDPISSLKISPLTNVTLHDGNFNGTKKLYENNDQNYHKMVRSLNINEIIGYKKSNKPIYHNWNDVMSSIEIN